MSEVITHKVWERGKAVAYVTEYDKDGNEIRKVPRVSLVPYYEVSHEPDVRCGCERCEEEAHVE